VVACMHMSKSASKTHKLTHHQLGTRVIRRWKCWRVDEAKTHLVVFPGFDDSCHASFEPADSCPHSLIVAAYMLSTA
jgi:hypothetical protein